MPERRTQWYIVWSYGKPDALAWLMLVAGIGFVVACIVIGWALGAAFGGFMLGALWVLFAFTSDHFRMTETKVGTPANRDDIGRSGGPDE